MPFWSMTRESQTEKDVCLWAKAHGILAVKFTPMGEVGWPDRIFLYKGKSVFIEFKATGKRARPLQEHRLEVLRDQQFIAKVHDNVDTAIQTLCSAFFPGNGNSSGNLSSSRRVPTGPRSGEDNNSLRDSEHTAATADDQEDVSDLPFETSLQRLAQATQNVE